jgi:hypothetical protein
VIVTEIIRDCDGNGLWSTMHPTDLELDADDDPEMFEEEWEQDEEVKQETYTVSLKVNSKENSGD